MAIPIAQIVKVEVPPIAVAGETVLVDVHLKNNSTNYVTLAITGVFDSNELNWQFDFLEFLPNETLIFRGWFTMPPQSVRLTIWSFYWDIGLGGWRQDETKQVNIALEAAAPIWQKLAQQAVAIAPVVAWRKLAQQTVTVTPAAVVAWQKLAQQAVTISPVEVAPEPEVKLIEETIYPYAYVYEGPHDGGVFTFKSDPFTPESWISRRLSAAVDNEVRKAGGRMLEMRVYVDRRPLLWSNWRIEVISAPPTTGTAMPLGIAWWAVAILAALAVALIIVITWSVKEIAGLFKRKPGLDQVKIGWGKEVLIPTIQASEEYWERSPTPSETLERMSEDDLRHLLNQIASEEVPAVPGLGWGMAVAAGVLGAGALAVLAVAGMGRRKS